jgi:PAS domain S-box-containing protein
MSLRIAAVAGVVTPRSDPFCWAGLFDTLPAAVYACDAAGRLVRYDSKAKELWGCAPDLGAPYEFCGGVQVRGIDGKGASASQAPITETIATGTPVRNRALVIARPDGSRVPAIGDFEPILNELAKPIGCVGCLREASTMGEAQRAFHESLQALPVAVYTTDPEGRITFFNEAAAALWQSRPELGSKWCGAWRLRTIDGVPLPHDQCPMAIAIREDREIHWARAIAERPDGTQVPFVAFPTPLHDASGKLTGGINTLIDMSSELLPAEAGMHLAAIVESSMDAIVSKNIDGIITSWNAAAARLFGYRAEEAIGQPITMLIPEGLRHEEASIIQRIKTGERVATFETTRRHKDGHLIPVSLTISPIRDAKGHIVGASKIARDITGNKENEQRIRLLMREVNHRVKNQYSVILSIIRETSRRWQDPQEFERHVRERIMALSDSHDLLVLADWKGATTYELLRAQVTPFADSERLSFSGPPVLLSPNAVQYLGIAFHELATNAAKHGALSSLAGQISVDWQVVTDAEGGKYFELTWTEIGGPPALETASSGFGTVVLRRVAPQAMGGTGEVVFADTGLVWRFRAPLANVASRNRDV